MPSSQFSCVATNSRFNAIQRAPPLQHRDSTCPQTSLRGSVQFRTLNLFFKAEKRRRTNVLCLVDLPPLASQAPPTPPLVQPLFFLCGRPPQNPIRRHASTFFLTDAPPDTPPAFTNHALLIVTDRVLFSLICKFLTPVSQGAKSSRLIFSYKRTTSGNLQA